MAEQNGKRTVVVMSAAVLPVVFAGFVYFMVADRARSEAELLAAQQKADLALAKNQETEKQLTILSTEVKLKLEQMNKTLEKIEKKLP